MIFSVYLKVVMPKGQVAWLVRNQEFEVRPQKEDLVKVCLPQRQAEGLKVRYVPDDFPKVVELASVETSSRNIRYFMRQINASDSSEKWRYEGYPTHVIHRAHEHQRRLVYRTSTVDKLVFYAEAPFPYRYPYCGG